MSKIAVFPASGKLASSTYNHLFEIINPAHLILISRYPEKTPAEYTEAGVITRKADYNEPKSLDRVFDDVSSLLLVSYPSIESEHRFEAHKLAIDAARRSTPGVSHIFYTSLAFGGDCKPNSKAHVMQAHLATEKYLTTLSSNESKSEKPLTFTAIREGIYSESFPMYTGFFDFKAPQNEIKIPHDGSGPGIAWAKIDELGEATARLVKNYVDSPETFEYRNRVILLSGPKARSIADTLKVAGKAVGKEVQIKQVSVEEYANEPIVIEQLGSHGPGEVPRQWATSFEAVGHGETAVVSAELGKLLGREPEDFEETVKAMARI